MANTPPENLHTVLTETLARHFPAARIEEGTIDLGFGGLRLECNVDDCTRHEGLCSASLFMYLSGGTVGDRPVFMSASGYADNEHDAVVTGGCQWACTFGPLLRAGLAGEAQTGVEALTVASEGRSFDVYVDGLDRLLSAVDTGVGDATRRCRTRLGGSPWLTTPLLTSGWLPTLDFGCPTIISTFVYDGPARRIVEVKINGCDWPLARRVFADSEGVMGPDHVLLRELAIVVPSAADAVAGFDRGSLERTLEGLATPFESGPRRAVRWPGWRSHGGRFDAALSSDELASVEAVTGPLPSDYRRFLTQVAGGGAGPGYGLVPPTEARALLGSKGYFEADDGGELEGDPQGVLLLADAGCGVVWLLVLCGPHRGEVWAAAYGSDERYHRVADSFDRWFWGWLDDAIRDVPGSVAWDVRCCATPGCLSQYLAALDAQGIVGANAESRMAAGLGPSAIKISSMGHRYIARDTLVGPCEGCVSLVERLGLDASVFHPAASPAGAAPASDSWWKRLWKRR